MPAAALEALDRGADVHASPAGLALLREAGREARPLEPGRAAPRGITAAPDAEAHGLALAHPSHETVPDRETLRARAIGADVARLVRVGAELRRECPWDREQTAETIVPHTIEEAFEVAEAVVSGDPVHLADELGDLLFQSVFLAGLLEETGQADLGSIADGQRRKLISRHPHVYGEEAAGAVDADAVVDVWERRKREERADQGIFHDLPPGLPALAYSTKALKRAAAAGVEGPFGEAAPRAAVLEAAQALGLEADGRSIGRLLLAVVALAREQGIDPELALRAEAVRFRARVEEAE